MKMKFCPLKQSKFDGEGSRTDECLTESCGMFDERTLQCSIKTVARCLDVIAELLDSVILDGQIVVGK